MGNPKRGNPSIDPLNKTIESLKQIKSALLPFVRLLKHDDMRKQRRRRSKSDDGTKDDEQQQQQLAALNPRKRAEAEAAVALAIGTLRYMGARLRGQDRGRKKGDPLRAELDKIRGMLVSLRKLESAKGGAADGGKKVSVPEKKTGGDELKKKNVSDEAPIKKAVKSDHETSTKKADKKESIKPKKETKRRSSGGGEKVGKGSKKKKQRR